MDERRRCGCVIPGIESPVRCPKHDRPPVERTHIRRQDSVRPANNGKTYTFSALCGLADPVHSIGEDHYRAQMTLHPKDRHIETLPEKLCQECNFEAFRKMSEGVTA